MVPDRIQTFWRWLLNLTMYRLMLYFLLSLLGVAAAAAAIGVLPYAAPGLLLHTALFVGVCWGLNVAAARLARVPANIESALITGLILAAIAGPLALPHEWLPLVVMAGCAIASKYLLVIRRSHIFNPAAAGVMVSALLLGYPASWWIGSSVLLPVVAIGGLLVLRKIRRGGLVAAFLGSYLGLLGAEALVWRGRGVLDTAAFLGELIISSPLLFFALVMLVEPLTSPRTAGRRLIFGGMVGGTVFALQRFGGVPYAFEAALLLGNLFARVLEPDFRQTLVLQRAEQIGSAIRNFWFTPQRPFAFAPGQFLEYTLRHPRADARGVRRYFTIASAPTEQAVLVSTRLTDGGSTFKQALRDLEIGGTLSAGQVAGDFVLPRDSTRKLAFIAGGIGVTPFRSMVKHLLDTQQRRDIVLLYAARTETELAFRDIFAQAEEQLGMRVVYVLSDKASAHWHGKVGRVDAALIRAAVPDFAERLWYISGPEPMVAAMARLLRQLGVPRRLVKRDYFPGYGA